jgi:hypothetical protein
MLSFQSVIESLPVSKYSVIHSSKTTGTSRTVTPQPGGSPSGLVSRTVSAPPVSAGGTAAAAAAAGGGGGAMSSFLAAAMQIREQVSRQTGVSTAVAAGSNGGSNAAAAGSNGGSNAGEREIMPSTSLAAPAAAAVAPGGASALAAAVSHKNASTAAAAAAVGGVRGGSLPPGSSSSGAEPCAICFDDFAADDDVKQLPCGHYFHPGCIDEWLVRVSEWGGGGAQGGL